MALHRAVQTKPLKSIVYEQHSEAISKQRQCTHHKHTCVDLSVFDVAPPTTIATATNKKEERKEKMCFFHIMARIHFSCAWTHKRP